MVRIGYGSDEDIKDIEDILIECFEKLAKHGVYFQSGTLVFNDIPLPSQGIQIVCNCVGD